ncbi:hypothetical protein MJD09_04685 [bacterium]|nr:hypothetical protein [bacterium]
MLRNVFFTLFTHFSIGLVFTSLFVSLQEIGRFFFRTTSFVALALVSLALAANPFPKVPYSELFIAGESGIFTFPKLSLMFFLLVVLTMVISNMVSPQLHKKVLAAACVFGILGVTFHSLAVHQPIRNTVFENFLYVVNGLGSTMFLGSALSAMITGHWYLVQHKLSMVPLKNTSKIYLLSASSRIVLVGLTIGFYLDLQVGSQLIDHVTALSFSGFLVISRVGFGLIIPLVFGFMVWNAAKIRSTQSATGILYATIVLALIGEAFAKYLYYAIGIPM